MGMIRIYQGKSKPANKKPGWKQKEAEYQAWLQSVQSQQLRPNSKPTNTRPAKAVKRITPIVNELTIDPSRLQKIPSLGTFGGAGTKPVARPELTYKDNPELLERELKARERKFTTAPAYNKGGDVLVTDEMMKDIMSGATRRRN